MVAAARYRRSSRYVHLAAVLAAIALFGAGAPAQSPSPTQYGFMALPTLGGAQSAVYDMSDSGDVLAGRAQTASGSYHAFEYGFDGMKDLGPFVGTDSTAFAIGFGVVGQAQTGGELHAFAVNRFRPQPSTDLGTLGGTWSAAYGTNSTIIVGASRTAGNVRLRAFEYVGGTMTALPVDLGGDSSARAINQGNDIVGYTCATGNALCRPFLLSNGVMTLFGPANRGGAANAITDEGKIVGTLSLSGSAAPHAFLYTNGTMTDLGTLGGASSEARALNELGEVVGSAQNAAGQPRAFLWRNGQMTDLNAFVPAGSGWTLESAAAISDGGQIAGYGTLNGKRRAFLLTPPTDLRLVPGGVQGQGDSNVPRSIEAGKTVTFITSAVGDYALPGVTVRDARMIHTLTGPAEFVSAQAFEGNTCEVTPAVVTCQIVHLNTSGIGREIHVRVRATGPGPFEHHATLTSGVPDPNPDNNSIEPERNRAVSMSAFTVMPTTIPGGKIAVGHVVLTGLPPAGDAVVRLTSSRPDIVPLPANFDIPAHAESDNRSFHIVPAPVSSPTTVQITASFGLVTITRTLTVLPPALRQLYLNPTTVIGGCGTSAGKVVLTGSAPAGGAVVPLSNTNPRATVPSTVTVPAGSDTVNFSVATTAVTANASGTVTASYGGVSQALSLGVRPIRAQLLTLSSSRVRGGTTVSGTVTLECPAAPGAVAVSLTSGNAAVAQPTQPSITLSAGATSGTFTVRTTAVSSDTSVTIYAWVFGVRKGVTLTVTP